MTMTPAELQRYAERGAKAQLERILAIFPNLAMPTRRPWPVLLTRPYATPREVARRKKVVRRPKKALHWTQTAAGKRKLSRQTRRSWQSSTRKIRTYSHKETQP